MGLSFFRLPGSFFISIICFALAFLFVASCTKKELSIDDQGSFGIYSGDVFSGNGFTPGGVAGAEPNIPPGYSDKDYQKAKYDKSLFLADNSKALYRSSKGEGSVSEKMLIKSGEARIEVESYQDAVVKIKESVKSYNGFIEKEGSERSGSEKQNGFMVIRIPSEKFDLFLQSFSTVGRVLLSTSSVEDVTLDYHDTALRLQNKRDLHKRLKELLATKAGRLSEVAELEEKIYKVTAEIESLQGKIRYYKHNVSMSRVELYLSEPESVVNVSRYPLWKRVGGAFVSAWNLFIGFIIFMISSLGLILPLGGAGYFFWQWHKQRKAAGKAGQRKVLKKKQK